MVKIIMGLKGSGKTKQLIDLVHKAVDNEAGDVVCIEKGLNLTYDIPYKVRLVDSAQYKLEGFEMLKGLICGLHAANYDITHIFVDSLLKIANEDVGLKMEAFIDWCESFSEREKVKFTIMISADAALATEGVKKYF